MIRPQAGLRLPKRMLLPNQDYKNIVLRYKNIEGLSINNEGDLIIKTESGDMKEKKPYTYQLINGEEQEVISEFELLSKNRYGFKVGDYDSQYDLIIDPGLEYSTYFVDAPGDLVLDSSNNVYITGGTSSTAFPTTSGAYMENLVGGGEVYVTKINPSGSDLVYSTFSRRK